MNRQTIAAVVTSAFIGAAGTLTVQRGLGTAGAAVTQPDRLLNYCFYQDQADGGWRESFCAQSYVARTIALDDGGTAIIIQNLPHTCHAPSAPLDLSAPVILKDILGSALSDWAAQEGAQ